MPVRHLAEFAAQILVSPKHQKHETTEARDRHHTPKLNNPGYIERVLIDLRIIVVAVCEDVRDRRANLVIRGVNQPQQHVLWRVLHAQVILRDAALRCRNLNRTCVRKLCQLAIRSWNTNVAKTDGVRQRLDAGLLPYKEMPPICRFRTAVTAQVEVLTPSSELRCLGGVHADDDNLEILPRC